MNGRTKSCFLKVGLGLKYNVDEIIASHGKYIIGLNTGGITTNKSTSA
jgi:hypothetical protein